MEATLFSRTRHCFVIEGLDGCSKHLYTYHKRLTNVTIELGAIRYQRGYVVLFIL